MSYAAPGGAEATLLLCEHSRAKGRGMVAREGPGGWTHGFSDPSVHRSKKKISGTIEHVIIRPSYEPLQYLLSWMHDQIRQAEEW